jgi:hypothetical protein
VTAIVSPKLVVCVINHGFDPMHQLMCTLFNLDGQVIGLAKRYVSINCNIPMVYYK